MGSAHFAHFAHLHCHSAYSLLEGTTTPQALVGAARKLGMPALALTDRNYLYGAVHFYVHALKAGVKPVIGMEVDLDDGSSLVLLARNMDGYRNLCHLATTLCRGTDPEAFQPAGFDEDDEADFGSWILDFGFAAGGGEIHNPKSKIQNRLPWAAGGRGGRSFAFSDKPRPPSI